MDLVNATWVNIEIPVEHQVLVPDRPGRFAVFDGRWAAADRPMVSGKSEMRCAKFVAAAGVLVVAGAARAHHSAAAEYRGEVKTWTGTIRRFAWMNPHTWLYFDMRDPAGKVTHWECEGSAPGGLMRSGWTRETLRPGMVIMIEGYPAKDRPEGCKVKAVILPGGRRLTMGSDEPAPR